MSRIVMSILVLVTCVVVASNGAAQSTVPKSEKPKKEAPPPPPPPKPAEKATETKAVDASKHVKRAVFTSSIVDREPTDQLDTLSTASTNVFFFTEFIDLTGKAVTHRWVFNGETKAEVTFQVGGPRWRVYSSKKLVETWLGTWTVEIVDEEGNKLHQKSFTYNAAE